MMQDFEVDSKQIDKIKKITTEEKNFRIKNLELFKEAGFRNVQSWRVDAKENWAGTLVITAVK